MFSCSSYEESDAMGLGYDLGAAFRYHNLEVASKPVEIVLELTGQNDGAEWHWILRLEGGTYAYVTGGCDYTGWDCQSSASVYEADTFEDILMQVSEGPRGDLRDMIEKGETARETRSHW